MGEPIERVTGEIMDAKSGEIIPVGATKEITTPKDMPMHTIDMATIGTLSIEDSAQVVLQEKLDPAAIRIRPNDGIIYLPWTYYASRLNRAFGIAQWGLIPQGMPMSTPTGKSGGVLVAWGHWLVVKGIVIGFAIGETTYIPSNPKMSYADACEGAKSNSLARNCKLLGMTLELWDHEFGETWKAQYATKDAKGDWVKKGAAKPAAPVAKPATTKAPDPAATNLSATIEPKVDPVGDVKKKWLEEAIKMGWVKNKQDEAGKANLIAILGPLYKDLAPFNANIALPQGIQKIKDWKPA